MKYSASTNGFYLDDHPAIPSDAVAITDAEHQAMLDGQARGLQIAADANGYPVLVPRVVATPTVVTMRQARLALLNAGLLTSVSNDIAAMTGTAGDAARIEWEFSPTLKRDHPLVASLSASLGLTSAQLDALFTAAAAL